MVKDHSVPLLALEGFLLRKIDYLNFYTVSCCSILFTDFGKDLIRNLKNLKCLQVEINANVKKAFERISE